MDSKTGMPVADAMGRGRRKLYKIPPSHTTTVDVELVLDDVLEEVDVVCVVVVSVVVVVAVVVVVVVVVMVVVVVVVAVVVVWVVVVVVVVVLHSAARLYTS